MALHEGERELEVVSGSRKSIEVAEVVNVDQIVESESSQSQSQSQVAIKEKDETGNGVLRIDQASEEDDALELIENGAKLFVGSLNEWIFSNSSVGGTNFKLNGSTRERLTLNGIDDGTRKSQLVSKSFNQNGNEENISASNESEDLDKCNDQSELHLLTAAEYVSAERNAIKSISRHYIAITIGCFLLLTLSQGMSLLLALLTSNGPVLFAIVLMWLSILSYWSYVWKVLHVHLSKLWSTPYPYAVTGAILGALSQHTILLEEKEFNLANMMISFCLVEAFYIILVAAAYKKYILKWKKKFKHRKLCYYAVIRDMKKVSKTNR